MMGFRSQSMTTSAAAIAFALVSGSEVAAAQDAGAAVAAPQAAVQGDAFGDIVVTAQKRSERLNDIPISITAASGDMLSQRGVTDTADLVKLVPGLNFTPSAFNTPVYTLRGIGFLETSLGASPAVSVYVDEIPLAFPVMTQSASLDLARVEVLKGPQGTLYGQNSTGGAVNYIAAKPTDSFEAGGDLSFGRFATADVGGFISGPISSTLKARLAVRTVQAGDWQRSVTRNEGLGQQNQTSGRIIVDWDPTSRLKVEFNFTASYNGSDTLAGQLIRYDPAIPSHASPILAAQPIITGNARDADWTPGRKLKADDTFYQAAARVEYELTDSISLTSISAYQHFDQDKTSDVDASVGQTLELRNTGKIKSFSQELRLSGDAGPLRWIVGGNYSTAKVNEVLHFDIPDASIIDPVPGFPSILESNSRSFQKVRSYAGFANADFKITDQLGITGGVRYTTEKRDFRGCSFNRDGVSGQIFGLLSSLVTGQPANIPLNGCFTLNAAGFPTEVVDTLDQNNVSWRAALNYKTAGNTLIYGSVSRGYKSGSFPTLAATNSAQLSPVVQESVQAYEIGVKAPLFNRLAQFNAAAFYYDYKDKQLRGRLLDPLFGLLEALVNVPKSRVWGLEADLTARPMDGLELMASGSYVNSKIKEFTGYGQTPEVQSFSGSAFPNTPKWQATADAQYTWNVSSNIQTFVGANVRYQGLSYATFFEVPDFRIKPYTLLDLRAGIQADDGAWRVSVWGRNVTNEYYWLGVFRGTDTTYRQPARPATYGITFTTRWK